MHHENALPVGHQIQEYEIQSMLGAGGFGITYLAEDTSLQLLVAIKEYLPQELAVRKARTTVVPKSSSDREFYQWGLERFLSEAVLLAKFKHPNIVRVLRFFEANGTAYMVMDYEAGQTLEKWLQSQSQPPDEATLKTLFLPILDGLRAVHKADLLHRDIKPENIYLREDGNPMLIDFGAARQSLGERSRSLSVVVSEGYAPWEQYSSRGKQGSWSDVYGVGASLYRCISGKTPLSVLDRAEALYEEEPDPLISAKERGKGHYAAHFLAAIDQALSFLPKDRPQTMREFHTLLFKGDAHEEPVPPTPAPFAEHAEVGLLPFEPEMVRIPAGRFEMGCVSGRGWKNNEKPMHTVRVQAFKMGKYAVTFDEWDACVADGGCSHQPGDTGWGRGNRPVINVSWNDAQEYVKWLSGQSGKQYRLPSEAEWEYAARAGTTGPFSFDDPITTDKANYDGCYKFKGSPKGLYRKKTLPVGSFPPNPWGLYDVHGNAYEWVEDCWNDNYQGAPNDGSAWRTGDCQRRVLRGGSWFYRPRDLRSAKRKRDNTGIQNIVYGFRVARTLTP